RGADVLDVGDLVSAIIVEDQDMLGALVHEGAQIGQVMGLEPHTPFFSQPLAANLLASVEKLLPRSNPIPDSADMTITADFGNILEAAEEQRQRSHHQQVEPLHLLAALLELPLRPEIDVLKDAGITEELVQAKLKEI
ncbi:MAG TPA: Clp protease N-terminal domain-containing protein, partial [Tepidisphaeraceae bacterium]|nr:Clp protease N-terminal domain-containing protein [Tepidisphaeraceae bacterium]